MSQGGLDKLQILIWSLWGGAQHAAVEKPPRDAQASDSGPPWRRPHKKKFARIQYALLRHNFRKLNGIGITIPKPLALPMGMKGMSQFKVSRTLLKTTGIMGKAEAVMEQAAKAPWFLLELRS